MSTIHQLYTEGKSLLKNFPEASFESKALLLKSLSISEETFYSHPDRPVSERKAQRFYGFVLQRQRGMPTAYIVREKEFWNLIFKLSPEVMIPRTETELLVEKVIALSSKIGETIVDIGTGCGNVAVSLARELTEVQIFASDISSEALKIAQKNAFLLGVPSIVFLEGDLFSPLEKKHLQRQFDFIVSNPPYVSENQWETLQEEIRLYEPKGALVPGKTGLEIIEKLFSIHELPYMD